jgi:hypothetical protein
MAGAVPQPYGSFSASSAEDATRVPALSPSPLTGLSAAGFDAVIAAAGGRAALAGVTTEQLKRTLVLPSTRHLAVPYCELLLAEHGAGAVGPATAFLSHAYDYRFLLRGAPATLRQRAASTTTTLTCWWLTSTRRRS